MWTTVLSACGLSRANLIYSGGGHCYLLLPNTKAARASAQAVNDRMNNWLIDQFGTRLFLAQGMMPCSASEQIDQYPSAEQTPYKAIFTRLSTAISQSKLHRYSASQLRRLNAKRLAWTGGNAPSAAVRMCCGRIAVPGAHRLRTSPSGYRTRSARWPMTPRADGASPWGSPLPTLEGEVYLTLMDEKTARKRIATDAAVRRVYTESQAFTGMKYSTRLDVCDYYASNQNEELARASSGISRLAVCRMDVDNLGQAFVAGFERGQETRPEALGYRFVALVARQRRFPGSFRCSSKRLHATNARAKAAPLQVSGAAMSGGGWLCSCWAPVGSCHRGGAARFETSLRALRPGALTLSSGDCAVWRTRIPIRAAAEETAVLEQRAKNEPGKNAVSLFDAKQRHTYPWGVFAGQVMDEKLKALSAFFQGQDERGMAFLYQMTHLLRAAQEDKLNLARYAYLLARLQPGKSSPTFALYASFSKQMYLWACSETDRTQLITAIYLYVYMHRKVE